MEILNLKDVTFWYGDSKKSALKDINLTVNEGEFVLIVGPSGCGKSTLLRMINRIIPDYYGGTIKGNIYLKGNDIKKLKREDIVKSVGMVYQHPEKQIVLQDVEREIAFGLENFNTEINKMKRNVCEVMSLLNINNIRHKITTEISGGEKQKVAIASVVSMDPDIILFDEPVSQLDPIAAEEVLNCIKKLNRDIGKTVILVEQRIDKCFDMADKVVFMENGTIVGEGTPHNIPENIDKKYFIPSLAYVYKKAGRTNIPINVKEGRKFIENVNIEYNVPKHKDKDNKSLAFEVRRLNFEYKKNNKVLDNINLKVYKGEVISVMGENGAGKSTLFKIVCGLIKKFKGSVTIDNVNIKKLNYKDKIKKIGYLSQNPNDYFGRDTVLQEVAYTLKNIDEYDENRVKKIMEDLDIYNLKDRNPRDLSGGEKQRVGIAATIVTNPDILILDEPTRGMDSSSKEKLGTIIRNLSKEGKSIVIITHDSDFTADYTDKLFLMFNGEIVASGNTEDIIYDSIYYSSQVAKVFKNKCKIVKTQDAINLLKVIK
ncbi:ABC transporter ATP-binding protein [Haloimpatiens sp. FM7330]|uniref:ABC transporter ATP-binding protein n=1 Tax=Haloimpatiens sp. FM7330 TaxID=3298610 RepID=UPI003630689F